MHTYTHTFHFMSLHFTPGINFTPQALWFRFTSHPRERENVFFLFFSLFRRFNFGAVLTGECDLWSEKNVSNFMAARTPYHTCVPPPGLSSPPTPCADVLAGIRSHDNLSCSLARQIRLSQKDFSKTKIIFVMCNRFTRSVNRCVSMCVRYWTIKRFTDSFSRISVSAVLSKIPWCRFLLCWREVIMGRKWERGWETGLQFFIFIHASCTSTECSASNGLPSRFHFLLRSSALAAGKHHTGLLSVRERERESKIIFFNYS